MADVGILRWLSGLLLCVLALHARAIAVTDDAGDTVDLPKAPQRIVSLLPSLSESVCALGRCDALVGVGDFSNWPERVKALPHVGGVDDVNIERVVALQPDIVLLSATSRVASRFQGLGIRVLRLEPRTLEDVRRVLDKLGRLLELPGEADRVWAQIDAGVSEAARRVPPTRRGTRVYFEVGSPLYAASESSHIGELLTRLGATNVVPGRLGSVPRLNPEFVVRANPQLIIVAAHEAPLLKQRPGWDRIQAVREDRVCALSPQQTDVVSRPGPRLAEAANVLAQCLRLAGGAAR